MNRLNQFYNYYSWLDNTLRQWREEGLETITNEKLEETGRNHRLWCGMVDAIRYQRNVE